MNANHVRCNQPGFRFIRTAVILLSILLSSGCAHQSGTVQKETRFDNGKVTIVLKNDVMSINFQDEQGLKSSHEFLIEDMGKILHVDQDDSLLPLEKLTQCPVGCSKKADFRECFKYCLEASQCCDNGKSGSNCVNLGID